jgi:hypothetical protein
MRLPAEMLRREGLAAPTAKAQIHIQSVVVLIVSISSLLGAGWIILNYAVGSPFSLAVVHRILTHRLHFSASRALDRSVTSSSCESDQATSLFH